jgi:hypothetical protein
MTSTASTSGAFRFVDGTLTEVERPAAPEPPPRGATPPHPGTRGPVPTELTAPELLLNRELTYLNFCWRVLHEAEDERVPLLERLKFVAIVSANIDEFFQKRIGGLKQQVGAGLTAVTPDGRSPTQQIAECLQMISDLERRKTALLDELRARLADHGVVIAAWRDLGADERAQVRAYYLDNIFRWSRPRRWTRPTRSRSSRTCRSTCWSPCTTPTIPSRSWPGSRCRSAPASRASSSSARPASCPSTRSWSATSICCSPAWRSIAAPGSGSPATRSPSARRARPTTCSS